MLWFGIAGAVLLVAVGWWLATMFQSPAQQEANAQAPAAAPVFASVTQGALSRELTFTGDVGPSTEARVTLMSTAGAALSVVTGRPLDTGATVSSGRVLTEVNGRPVFGALSPFAFYRDLGYGDRGPDVSSLQAVLADLGYDVTTDGEYGARTARAVLSWYLDNGYTAAIRPRPQPATPDSGAATSTDAANAGQATSGAASDAAPSDPGSAATAPIEDPYVPVAEILAMTSGSARVIQGVAVGATVAVSGAVDIVLGATDTIVTVNVAPGELGDVAEGDAALISFDGTDVEATVGSILIPPVPAVGSGPPDETAASGADGSAEATFVVIPKTPLSATAATGQARVTVTKDILAQDALLVPVLAITDRGPGDTLVTVRRADGSLAEIPVTILGTLQGQVAIEPADADALRVGDEVRVG